MNYRIEVRPAALKQILKLEESNYSVITPIITSLGEEPRPQGVTKLAGSPLWRIRVRDFRIVYSIDDDEKVITVVRIARRNEETYKNL